MVNPDSKIDVEPVETEDFKSGLRLRVAKAFTRFALGAGELAAGGAATIFMLSDRVDQKLFNGLGGDGIGLDTRPAYIAANLAVLATLGLGVVGATRAVDAVYELVDTTQDAVDALPDSGMPVQPAGQELIQPQSVIEEA